MSKFPEAKRLEELHKASDRWIESEMWNQRGRRPADLHDVAAFVRGFNEGVRLSARTWLDENPVENGGGE